MIGEALWTVQDVAAATGGKAQGDWQASGVSIDSRTLEPGDLFIALAGPNFDGHEFVGQALDKGAAAVMVTHLPHGREDAPAIVVDDTLTGLTDLGRAGRARSRATVIAVTGSVGKTGTKEALAHCLAGRGKVHASVGSFNNHWGVPLSLSRLPRAADYAVFELGMNHPGEIRALTSLVRPHVAIVTTIAEAHTEFFQDLGEIARAKAEIFEGVEDGGAAVLPRDNPYFEVLERHAREAGCKRIIRFGEHAEADVRLLGAALYSRCSAVKALVRGEPLDYCLSLPGHHWVINSLGVLAAVLAADADPVDAAQRLAQLKAPRRRGEWHKISLAGGDCQLIDDSYNANPTSMRAALAVLGDAAVKGDGRRIAVLGDMLELGAQSRQLHTGLATAIEETGIDLVYTCGPEMAALAEALPKSRRGAHAPDAKTLARMVGQTLKPGDLVLVKGSAGSRMNLIVTELLALANQGDDPANGNDGTAPVKRAANGG